MNLIDPLLENTVTSTQPVLKGVHHTARPTWKLRETVEFYRDKLGLPLVHAISARGWGPANHPDFLHFFFDSGNGSTIAFFYYIGHEQPPHLVHRPTFDNDAIHTAWHARSREELLAWRSRLETHDVPILFQVEHEVLESIYFRDPNGYFVEIALALRELNPLDASDAALTLQAAIEDEDRRLASGLGKLRSIESVWRAKGDLIEQVLLEEA